jgi:hypothetical protein
MCSLEMAKLFAWLSAASRVQSRCAVLSRTHRLTLPYSLDDWAMSSLGEPSLADGRMDDGGWLIAPPWHSGGESERAFAGQAQALFLAVRAPAGWQRPHRLCPAGPPSGAGPRRPVRCVGALWSAWFWGVCSVLRSRRDRVLGSEPAMCRASFSRRPRPGRCPLGGRLPGSCRWRVVGVVRACAPWGTSLEPVAVLVRRLFGLDGMAPSSRVRLLVAALGRGQRLRVTGCGPLTGGRPAAGGGAPVRQRLPIWPSGLTQRAPCGWGPSPGGATGGRWPSAWAPPGLNRPTSTRTVSRRSQGPSPEVEAPGSHADSATAPPSPR